MREFRPNDEIAIGTRVITCRGASRVAHEAFEIACTRRRRKVTAVNKEPVFRLTCGMFAGECRKVAAEFPEVPFEEAMVDTIAMKPVMNPKMLFEWLARKCGEPKAAEVAGLIARVIAAKALTADLGGRAGTAEMGDAIAAAV